MFDWLKNRGQDRAKAQNLYGAVVTLARTSRFYSDFGVADTPEGRFEMVALCLFLVLDPLKTAHGEDKLVQATIEAFVTDMDDCMREMGVGDLVVPKRVKRAAAAFYERAGIYRAHLSYPQGDAADLAAALAAHVPAAASPLQALRLAALVQQMRDVLSRASASDLVEGRTVATLRTLIDAAGSSIQKSHR